MPVQDTPAINNDDKAKAELMIRSLKELARRAQELSVHDKADVLDLILDLILTGESLITQPEKIQQTWQLVEEIVLQKEEDVETSQMPDRHDAAENEDATEYDESWKVFIADRVKGYRVERKWTQDDLAEKSGLPQSHISRIESAKHSPSRKTVERLAEAFGVPVGELDPSDD